MMNKRYPHKKLIELSNQHEEKIREGRKRYGITGCELIRRALDFFFDFKRNNNNNER